MGHASLAGPYVPHRHASFQSPANLPLARELWTQDATGPLRNVEIPTLVLIGRKDVQIDAVTDGHPLEQAAAANDNVTFAYPANANHVFKEETRLPAEVPPRPATATTQTAPISTRRPSTRSLAGLANCSPSYFDLKKSAR